MKEKKMVISTSDSIKVYDENSNQVYREIHLSVNANGDEISIEHMKNTIANTIMAMGNLVKTIPIKEDK